MYKSVELLKSNFALKFHFLLETIKPHSHDTCQKSHQTPLNEILSQLAVGDPVAPLTYRKMYRWQCSSGRGFVYSTWSIILMSCRNSPSILLSLQKNAFRDGSGSDATLLHALELMVTNLRPGGRVNFTTPIFSYNEHLTGFTVT